jgi:predicted permease
MTPLAIQEVMYEYRTVFAILAIWDLAWKMIALWYTAREGKKWWFIALAVFNTMGIFPIVYLIATGKLKKDGFSTAISKEVVAKPAALEAVAPKADEPKKEEGQPNA